MIINNKLKITDYDELARAEEKLSKKKAIELFESGYLNSLNPGEFSSLARIHELLFNEIYDFAGKLRDVNISKGNFSFAPALYLTNTLNNIDNMKQSTFEEIIEKYVEMNIAHPFREGNGRSMRIWLDLMLKKELNQVVNWTIIDKDTYLFAMERSPMIDTEIKRIIKEALTDKIEDIDIYMNGIDASYYYEGLFTYNTKELKKESTR